MVAKAETQVEPNPNMTKNGFGRCSLDEDSTNWFYLHALDHPATPRKWLGLARPSECRISRSFHVTHTFEHKHTHIPAAPLVKTLLHEIEYTVSFHESQLNIAVALNGLVPATGHSSPQHQSLVAVGREAKF